MADPKIRIKRSAVAGRIPSVDQVPLGELALNTWDGQLYASKNVGLGTTVVAVNPWLVGTGTDSYNAYFTAGNIGIGITVPTSTLHVSGDALFTSTLTATDSELYTEFDITNNGTSAYQFASTGIGFTQNTDNPTLYLSRGKNYKFDVNASGHPFEIRSSLGGSAYNDGVVNNGAQVGIVTFKIPYNAPSLLYYQCTVHSGMNGKIYVVDAGVGPDVNVNTTGIITANSFVKSGGTSSEFLKADGSVDSSTYLTAESDTLDSVTGRGGVTSNNISVGMLTATAAVVGSAVTLNSGGVVAGLGTFNSFNTTQLQVTGISTLGHTIAGSAVTMTSGGIVAGLGTINYINATHLNATGVVTANAFVGDGSGLTGIVAGGSGVVVKDSGSLVGTAGTIDFGTNLSVSPISAGVVTVTASGGGSGVGYFVQNSTGIHTTSSVGIGTTTASGAAADPNNTTILNAGIVTANYFYGDGSGLTGIVAASSGIIIRDSNSLVGTAATVNFGTGLSVTPVSAGIVTVNNLSRTSGVDRTTTSFTATAGQTTFTVSYEISNPIDVFLNGVRLRDTVDYAATSGTNIVLTSGAAASDSLVVIEYFATTGTTNEKHAVDRVVTEFTATAGQTTFSVTYTVGNIDVFFNGARLIASDYTATDGTSVVLTSAAAGGDQIVVVEYLVSTTGNGISGQTVTTFTATAGQTTFNVSYTLGTIQVYRNGIRLVEDSDYTANTGNTIVLTSAASGGDSVVVVESQGLFGVNQTGINTTSNLGIGTTSAYNALTVVGNANISGVVTATGGFNIGIQSGGINVVTGVVTALNFVGTGNTFLYNPSTKVVDISIQGGGGGTIGISSAGTRIGTGFTDLNIIGTGVSIVGSGTTVNIQVEPGLVGAAKSVTSFTATAGQTTFNVNYSQGQENVFLNGVRLSESQYTATNGSTVVLNDAASDGDSVDIVVYLRGADPNRNVEVTLLPPFNGITTAFTMYKGTTSYLFDPIDDRQIVVSLGGVIQQPGVAYTVGTGSSIFFSAAPGAGVSCFITALYSNTVGVPTDAVKLNKQTYTPSGIQTTFTVTEGYRSGYLDVYVNGARLVDGSDFTASNGTTFDLVTPANGGDIVDVIAYQTLNIQYAEFAGLSTNVDGGYGSLTNLQVSGITTLGNVLIGVGGTDLLVEGNARVTGILTVGPGSITLDGINNKISGITETQTSSLNVGTGGTVITTLPNGSIGIGITTPTTDGTRVLHIKSEGTGQNCLIRVTGNTGTGVDLISGGDSKAYLWNRDNTDLLIGTNNTEKARFLANGGLTFNGDTAAANALDDYEEGTWSPQVTQGVSGTPTYEHQYGWYTKIGRLVTLYFYLRFASSGNTGDNSLFGVGNFPFPIISTGSNTTYHRGMGVSNYHSIPGFTSASISFYGAGTSGTYATMYQGSSIVATSSAVNSVYIIGGFEYFT